MKKVFLVVGIFCACVISAIVCKAPDVENSDLALKNVEALSSDEDTSDCTLSLLKICTSGNKDHHFYRRVEQ